MVVTLEMIYEEILEIKDNLIFIRHLLEEKYDLSDETKKKLDTARNTPSSEYISHEEVMTKYG